MINVLKVVSLSGLCLWGAWWKYKNRGTHNEILLLLTVAMIISFTLVRTGRLQTRQAVLAPFQSMITLCAVGWHGHGRYIFHGLVGNVLLFAPLGLCLSSQEGRFYKYLVPLLLSLTVEIIQYFACLGTFEVDDLICNTIGGILGYELGKQISRQRKGYFVIPGLYLAAVGLCCMRSILFS